MHKFKIFLIALIVSTSATKAQSVAEAKTAIDAEQFEKAKTILKTITRNEPQNGTAAFLLGNIYLKQNVADSAKIFFEKGVSASDGARLNYIGLGQLELDKGNTAAAEGHFATATKGLKKKETEPYVYVARAYINSDRPNYNSAISILNKAIAANPNDAEVLLALGDAHYGNKNQNDAYASYRNALQADKSMIRAKMQQGVLLKGAKAFTEAVKAFNDVIATNPNYGPVYRELAETYYLWGSSVPAKYTEHIKTALSYYEKYMSLTDYSLASRMRHADFLILARDYKALEVEANKMKELDNVNPRILRYLGYSAYENGNVDVALTSLTNFIANPASKVIAKDYVYLGLAKIKKASADETKIDQALYNSGIADMKKAVEMDITVTEQMNELGKRAYEQKQFQQAAAIFEIAVTNPKSSNFLIDNFYLGNSLYYANSRGESTKPDAAQLQKADVAFGNVIAASPTTQDAYLFRARTNRLLENDEAMASFYDQFVKVVSEKGAEEVAANKAKIVEAYNNTGAHFANTDKAKAIEYFNKTLAIDPSNAYAIDAIKSLK
ncbi:MAG TPA: tetratricopeptide repeat protein [Flavobacterium sp.]